MNKIFENIDYIRDSEIFKPIIDKLNNNIKERLIISLDKHNKNIILQRKRKEDSNIKDYFSTVSKKVARRRNKHYGEYS